MTNLRRPGLRKTVLAVSRPSPEIRGMIWADHLDVLDPPWSGAGFEISAGGAWSCLCLMVRRRYEFSGCNSLVGEGSGRQADQVVCGRSWL